MRTFKDQQQNRVKSGITVVSRRTGLPVGFTVPHNFYRYTSSATRVSEAAINRGRKTKG